MWREYITRWKYLLDSYQGGKPYKVGRYLTKYQMETALEYEERITNTGLDNHCKSVIQIYNGFLFRDGPDREFGSIENEPLLQDFLEDADFEGRDMNAFMRDVCTYSSIFGHAWVILYKPNVGIETKAEEQALRLRPYSILVAPVNVIDWRYERSPNGMFSLSYLKYVEEDDGLGNLVIKELTPERIRTHSVNQTANTVVVQEDVLNELGEIPATCIYSQRSLFRGIGVSDIDDVADLQRMIYNEYSEIEQLTRIANHPSLVKTPDVEAMAGAGGIIQMPETLDPGLKPYLLQPSGSSLTELYKSIQEKVDAIGRITHTQNVRQMSKQTVSGIAMETEFQMLNARLAEKADNLEVAEEKIWGFWAKYMGYTWDGEITYPETFNIQDTGNKLLALKTIRDAKPDNQLLLQIVDLEMLDLITTPEELLEYKEQLGYAPEETGSEENPQSRTVPPTGPIPGTPLQGSGAMNAGAKNDEPNPPQPGQLGQPLVPGKNSARTPGVYTPANQ